MPDYTVLDEYPHLMTHEARQQPYETNCDGCKQPLPGKLKWSELNNCYMFGAMMVGPFVTVITDRSGSEYGVAHRDATCIELAAIEITEGE